MQRHPLCLHDFGVTVAFLLCFGLLFVTSVPLDSDERFEANLDADSETRVAQFQRIEGASFEDDVGPAALGFYDPILKEAFFFTEGRQTKPKGYRMDPRNISATTSGFEVEGIKQMITGVVDTTENQTRFIILANNTGSYNTLFSIDSMTLSIVDQFELPISSEAAPAMVLGSDKTLYIGTKSLVTAFMKIQIYPSFSLKVRSNELGIYNPNCGFVDNEMGFVYFGTLTSPICQIIRVHTSNGTISEKLTLLPDETRLATVAYDSREKRAFFGVGGRDGRVVVVDILHFRRLGSIVLSITPQNIHTSYIDLDGKYAYFGTRTAPGVIFRVNVDTFQSESSDVVVFPNKEDAVNTVAFVPEYELAIWGCSGFESLDPISIPFVVIVSATSPKIDVSPITPTPGQQDDKGDDGDSVAAIPVPIFVATLFLSVGAVSIGSIIYYRRKVSRSGLLSDVDPVPYSGPSLPVDSNVKKIDFNEIELGTCIGVGGMGEVYRGVWNGTEIAVKKLHMSYQSLNNTACNDIAEEMLLHSSLRHPNIITFLGACVYPPNICICLEYMPRHSLYEVLHNQVGSKLEWKLIIRMAIDAAKGLNFLHCSKPIIIHRDLKSHNLLVDSNWNVKVTDFGSARIKQHFAYTMTCIGTPQWMAPEVIRGEHYSEKCDVFSFGIVLWEMFTQEDPYKAMNPIQVATAVAFRDMRPPIPMLCPPSYHSLMVECWDGSPRNRPSFKDALRRLPQMSSE